jgi:hypothetical protein
MGVARLLAKGWVVFCVFAGAYALTIALQRGAEPLDAIPGVVVSDLLFTAMGLLFIGGFGAASGQLMPFVARFKPADLIPGFNELVFVVFAALSFVDQVFFAPGYVAGPVAEGLERAIAFVVPGQAALVDALSPCGLDGGRIFAFAFTWLLAIIYLGSAVSRLRLAAGIIRIERAVKPDALGPLSLALVLGALAIAAIQLLYMGSVFPFLTCSAFTDVPGALLIGLAPLMLSYLIVAALASAMAVGPE